MKLKRQLLVLIALCLAMLGANAQITQGLKLPQLTTTERDLIQKQGDPNNPYASGQVIYNLDNNCLEYWNGAEWVSKCAPLLPPITPKSPDFPEDLSGTYRLDGKTCFDVKRGNDNINDCMPLVSRTDDFESEFSFTYTFSGTESYTDLTFYIDNNNNNLLASVSTTGDVFTITFKSDIHSLAAGTDKTTAKKLTVVAAYKNNLGDDKVISLGISVQDCSCGCPVKTVDGGWLTFLCYNLGADPTMTIDQQMAYTPSPNTTTSTDSTVYGALYQWGRNTDGHEKRTSGTTTTLATTDTPGHSNFILAGSGMVDWRSPQNANLWQPSTGINNPCPAGWRVPTQLEWDNIFGGANGAAPTTAKVNKWTWNSSGTAGFKISPDNGITTTLFLPAAGWRGVAGFDSLDTVGKNGHYWSSTLHINYSYDLAFGSSSVSPNNGYNGRAEGHSVRCVADQ